MTPSRRAMGNGVRVIFGVPLLYLSLCASYFYRPLAVWLYVAACRIAGRKPKSALP